MSGHHTYHLPSVTNPTKTRCYLIELPDDLFYIAAFHGAVYNLSKPYAWANDNAHTALDAGARMLTAYETLHEVDCSMAGILFAACDSPDCGIKYSTDGGSTWTCINLDDCISGIVATGIQNAIDNGLLQKPGGQLGPQLPPAPLACSTYHVVLAPGERWHSPIAVASLWTIQITNAKGGWSIGELNWYCPDGHAYAFGACGTLQVHHAGDPLATAWHMALIGQLDDTTNYFDPLTSTYTVPLGTDTTDFFILANTNLTLVPSGNVEFDVTVCAPAYLWCRLFDFTLDNGGWYGASHSCSPQAVYDSGVGWGFGCSGYNVIDKDYAYPADVRYVDVYRDFQPDSGRDRVNWYNPDYSLHQQMLSPTTAQWEGPLYHSYFDPGMNMVDATHVEVFGDNAAASGHVVRVILRGPGTNPFGADNC